MQTYRIQTGKGAPVVIGDKLDPSDTNFSVALLRSSVENAVQREAVCG
jgi:hypothetical protein